MDDFEIDMNANRIWEDEQNEKALKIAEAIKRARGELRDEFAMAALTGMLATDPGLDVSEEVLATVAYSYADAMLKARSA